MTFKFSGSASAFAKVLSHMWEALDFFKGICSKLAQKRDNAAKRGWGEGGMAGASWKDPPRICWIKSLHLDIIVLLLCWELPLPQRDQISGWKMATCQDSQPHLVSYFNPRQNALLALLLNDYFVYGLWINTPLGIAGMMSVEWSCTTPNKTILRCVIAPQSAKWIVYMCPKSNANGFVWYLNLFSFVSIYVLLVHEPFSDTLCGVHINQHLVWCQNNAHVLSS